MSTLLRTGVIGLGILGSQHARLIHKRADFELTAVADLRADLAQSLAAETGASPYTEYQEMLREHALDLVVIATPDPYHRKPALAALSALRAFLPLRL